MSWIDWLIVIVPVTFVVGMGFYSRRYIRSVADFLAAGRVCGRYVISIGNLANALAIITLVSYVESHYRTGFATAFWIKLMGPLAIFMGLFGFCTYRFRETKAMSLGQFLEMRYNRPFRIFAASLRSLSEILANMIMPAVAARFFIYFLDLPHSFFVFGIEISTFGAIMIGCLTVAIGIICMGGTLALIITDAIQGIIFFPLIAIFVVFVLSKFSWSGEIVPVMMDRVPKESFLNPYDISELRHFGIFFVIVMLYNQVAHRASWIGAGSSGAGKTPHEQKMAGLLGTFRGSVNVIFYVLIAVTIITLLNHKNWAPEGKTVRENVSTHISQELIADPIKRAEFDARIAAVPPQTHLIGVDAPLSQKVNLDTPILETAHDTFKEFDGEDEGNANYKQYKTLFHQMMLGASMREILPTGLLGLFCLLMIMAMISTDDTRIYSATLTLTQDVIMPLRSKPFSPKQHVWALRIVAISIGVFFFCGSFFMSQLDYIQLFVTLMTSMWLGGCAPVMLFGLYSRFGTTAGAFTSLITGMFLSFGAILVKRNWAEGVYPWLLEKNWVEPIGKFLETVSRPLNPVVKWEMSAVDFPIDSYEIYIMISIITLFLYIVVSYLTMKEPFNMDRMLHRGKYNLDHENKEQLRWSLRTVLSKMVGITKEYTIGDKVIAWTIFFYSFVWGFLVSIVGVVIWNAISPWPTEWWGQYFLIVFLVIPGIVAAIATVWFGIGGTVDLFRMFRDLKARAVNPLDDGWVEGHVSLSDKAEFEQLDSKKLENDAKGQESTE